VSFTRRIYISVVVKKRISRYIFIESGVHIHEVLNYLLAGGVQAISAPSIGVGKSGCLEAAACAETEFCVPAGEGGGYEGCGDEDIGEGDRMVR
jgi:hypothetical protein